MPRILSQNIQEGFLFFFFCLYPGWFWDLLSLIVGFPLLRVLSSPPHREADSSLSRVSKEKIHGTTSPIKSFTAEINKKNGTFPLG